jgi:pyruvate/2-oxoglutarate dehydrogenase complex dihydrolipoamide dehydrogenase (E3) component
VTGPTAIDMGRVRQRKRDMVDGLITMHLDRYKASGAELIMGSGRFVAPKRLEVRLNDGGTRELAGNQVFLNLGTRATIPAIPGLAGSGPLTNIEVLELDQAPEPPRHSRRRVCRPRIGPGVPALREPRDYR